MKSFRTCSLAASAVALVVLPCVAADLYWDAGSANIGTNGDGVSLYASGTWSTALANWDQGAGLAHLPWNNSALDSAIFGGNYSTGTKTVTIATDITVNQIKINTGSTSGNRYDIGASASQNDFAITFGGTYSDAVPALSGSTSGFVNNNFNAKITGTVSGGLVIQHGSNITTPGSSGRFNLTNTNNNFVGDVVLIGGNLAATSQIGNPANKFVLKGGALFVSGGAAATSTVTRAVEVAAPSGISTNAATTGLQILDLTGPLTGAANLTRYSATAGSATSEVRLSGDLSGYTGTIDCQGTAATILTIQSTAPSGGTWKLSGGTLKLNTTDNTHIADGPGQSNLVMNGGTLDLNGKSETINGLAGATGTVQDQLASTTSTLTLGAGDATASFGGTIRNNAGTGGTLALTKTGSGTQTLGGTCSHTGATTIEGGTLLVSGTLAASPVTVRNNGTLRCAATGKTVKSLALEDGAKLDVPLDLTGNPALNITEAMTFSGGTVTVVPRFASVPAPGTYNLAVATLGITGTADLVADFSPNGASRVGGSAQLIDGTTLQVTVESVGANLFWNNAATTGTWNLDGDANFLNEGANDVFKDYDHVTFGPTSPAGTITLSGVLQPATVTVDSSDDITFAGSGSWSGGAALSKSGIGTLTVNTINNNTGATTVNGGALVVNGALGSGAVTVAPVAALKGTGLLGGAVTVSGVIAPGPEGGTGTLGTGALALAGTYACDLDGSQNDRIAVTGNLNLTGSTLSLNEINPPAGANHVIATYTGSLTSTFAAPAGYEIDTSEAGKVVLWPVTTPAGGTITFESTAGYPNAPVDLAPTNGASGNAPYDGTNGWSRSVSSSPLRLAATTSSGEYRGGQALTANGSGTCIDGVLGNLEVTGENTVSFDAQYRTGISVGFINDNDGDGLFDQGSGGANGDTGLCFGIGGSPAGFQYRAGNFGTETQSGIGGTTDHWYHFHVTIGAATGGSRPITMAVRDLTAGTDVDFEAGTPGTQPWTFSVTEAAFGAAPEESDGLYIRLTGSAKVDNIRMTTVTPPAGSSYDTWMNGFPTLTGNDRLPESDPDHDGLKNLLEFVLGADPRTSDPGLLPQAAESGGDLVLSFLRSDESESYAGLALMVGGNLIDDWTEIPLGAGDGSFGDISWTVEERDAAPDLVTVRIPRGIQDHRFARLKASVIVP